MGDWKDLAELSEDALGKDSKKWIARVVLGLGLLALLGFVGTTIIWPAQKWVIYMATNHEDAFTFLISALVFTAFALMALAAIAVVVLFFAQRWLNVKRLSLLRKVEDFQAQVDGFIDLAQKSGGSADVIERLRGLKTNGPSLFTVIGPDEPKPVR